MPQYNDMLSKARGPKRDTAHRRGSALLLELRNTRLQPPHLAGKLLHSARDCLQKTPNRAGPINDSTSDAAVQRRCAAIQRPDLAPSDTPRTCVIPSIARSEAMTRNQTSKNAKTDDNAARYTPSTTAT